MSVFRLLLSVATLAALAFLALFFAFILAWLWAWLEQSSSAGAPASEQVASLGRPPLLATLVLLASAATVIWARHALQRGKRGRARAALLLAAILGAGFVVVQAYDYAVGDRAFAGGVHSATYFMGAGHHGLYAVIGVVLLAAWLVLPPAGPPARLGRAGFDAAIWYWHFVTAIWLLLVAFAYVAPAMPALDP
jgi:cytochrome c oxidase subunit 3